jgi:hypothetical protein
MNEETNAGRQPRVESTRGLVEDFPKVKGDQNNVNEGIMVLNTFTQFSVPFLLTQSLMQMFSISLMYCPKR